MGGTNTAAFGIYAAREHLEEAVSALRGDGFRATDISVLFPYNVGSKDFAVEKGTKAPEAAVTGAGTGAILGATLGWLAGIGTLAIPGFGPLLAAGPLVAALAGIGAGGTVGGVTGALVGLGMPEYEAKRYDGRLRNGGILLSVHCDSAEWARKAEKLLERTGAQDVSCASESNADYARTTKPLPREGSLTNLGEAKNPEPLDV